MDVRILRQCDVAPTAREASLGIGAEDLGAIHHLHEKACRSEVGIVIELGGRRDAHD